MFFRPWISFQHLRRLYNKQTAFLEKQMNGKLAESKNFPQEQNDIFCVKNEILQT